MEEKITEIIIEIKKQLLELNNLNKEIYYLEDLLNNINEEIGSLKNKINIYYLSINDRVDNLLIKRDGIYNNKEKLLKLKKRLKIILLAESIITLGFIISILFNGVISKAFLIAIILGAIPTTLNTINVIKKQKIISNLNLEEIEQQIKEENSKIQTKQNKHLEVVVNKKLQERNALKLKLNRILKKRNELEIKKQEQYLELLKILGEESKEQDSEINGQLMIQDFAPEKSNKKRVNTRNRKINNKNR